MKDLKICVINVETNYQDFKPCENTYENTVSSTWISSLIDIPESVSKQTEEKLWKGYFLKLNSENGHISAEGPKIFKKSKIYNFRSSKKWSTFYFLDLRSLHEIWQFYVLDKITLFVSNTKS